MATFLRICFYSISIFMIIIGLFFTGVGIFIFKGIKSLPEQPCVKLNPIQNIIHRADTTVAQENTIDAIKSITEKGYGVEFDIFKIASGEYILFHDYNALETTGVDLEIEKATIEDIKKLKYSKTIHGKTYDKERGLALFKDALDVICNIRNTTSINFDLKNVPSKDVMSGLMDIVDASPCDCTTANQLFIYETAYFYATGYIRDELLGRRCKKVSQVGVYIHPDTTPLGVYIWLKSKHIVSYGSPDTISTYYRVWEAYPELVKQYKNDGYCISTYGDFEEPLSKFYVDKYRVTDISTASYLKIPFERETGYYTGVIILFVVGLVLITIFSILVVLVCCNCICSKTNKVKSEISSEMKQ